MKPAGSDKLQRTQRPTNGQIRVEALVGAGQALFRPDKSCERACAWERGDQIFEFRILKRAR